MYSVEFRVEGDKIYDCLASEAMEYDRSSFKINKTERGVRIDVTAKDAVALRATLNSISQLFLIYEKTKLM
ncbi:MAG: KEOPS complex subunit Pcc1 [Candidatus Nanoarchaeia archaeon]